MPLRPVIHFENCYHSSAFQYAEEQDIKNRDFASVFIDVKHSL
jgi:hypothetical protein